MDAFNNPIGVGAFVYAYPAGFAHPTVFRVIQLLNDNYVTVNHSVAGDVTIFGGDTVVVPAFPAGFNLGDVNPNLVSDIVGRPVNVDDKVAFFVDPGGVARSAHVVNWEGNLYHVVLVNGKPVTVDVNYTVRLDGGWNPRFPINPVDIFTRPINVGDPIVHLTEGNVGGNYGMVVNIRGPIVDVVPAGTEQEENPHALPVLLRNSIVLPGRVITKLPTLSERGKFKEKFVNLDITGVPLNINDEVLVLRQGGWGTGIVVGFTAAKVRVQEENNYRPILKFGYELLGNIPGFNHNTMSFSNTNI